MSWNKKQKSDEISEKEWKIVEERLKTMPSKMKLGILSKSYSRQDLLLEVQNKSEIGKVYVEMQMEFISIRDKWLCKFIEGGVLRVIRFKPRTLNYN